MSDWRNSPGSGEPAPDLDELRGRLDALQDSVESLGRDGGPAGRRPQGAWEVPAPGHEPWSAPQPPAAPPYDHASPPPADYYAPPPPPPVPPPYPQHEPAYGTPGRSDWADPAYEPQAPGAYAPAPAATNGEGEGGPALPANVAIVDAGPFTDLIELRHFEEAVMRLEAVRDVHVRRFGHRRAKVEIGMVGPYAVGRELYRLGRPMVVEPGADGEIVLEFTDVPAEHEDEDDATEAEAGPEGEEPEYIAADRAEDDA